MHWSIPAAYSPLSRCSSPAWYSVLPSGGWWGSSGVTYPGITRFDWVNLHTFTGFAFATLPIIHLLLHWQFFGHIRKTLSENITVPCDTTE
jgi:hypothetical protein